MGLAFGKVISNAKATVEKGAFAIHREAVSGRVEKDAITATVKKGAATATVEKGAATATVENGAVTGTIENGAFNSIVKDLIREGAIKFQSTIQATNNGMVVIAALLVMQMPDPSGNVRHVLNLTLTVVKYGVFLLLAVALTGILLGGKQNEEKTEEKKEETSIDLEVPTHLVAIGNPGAGKSTLLNGLLGRVAFQSGLAFKGTLTRKEQLEIDNRGNTFIDTPGLSDFATREEAAEEITKAIRKNASSGKLKLLFELTLEQARARATDIVTMNLVLDALPSNTPYGIIVNRVEPGVLRELHSNPVNHEHLLVSLNQGRENVTSLVHFIELDPDLNTKTNAVPSIDAVTVTFINHIPCCDALSDEEVGNVAAVEHQRLADEMSKHLEHLQRDKEEMRKEMKKMEDKYRNKTEMLEKKAMNKKLVYKDVGSIESEAHAPEVVNRWLASNPGWDWNGHWVNQNGTSYAGMVPKAVDMEVGPIWSNAHAPQIVFRWLAENPGWEWNGHWVSKNGTSYAGMVRKTG